MSQNIHDILKKYWDYDSFRDFQEAIIQSVIDGNNTLALLPTGGGKSICYQVPAIASEGICIVISPLIALMKDQVENLNKRGIKALAIFSGMSKKEIDIALDNCVYGNYKFLYVSPERLQTEIFQVRLAKMKVNLVAIDEAHCISQWGHDFRPSYKLIPEIKKIIPKEIPFLAVTATANNRVIKDITETVGISKSWVFKQSFVRKNLGYLVLKEENKEERLLKILRKSNSCGIVYVNTRKNATHITHFLLKNGIKADFYHGGLGQQERDKKQLKWLNDEVQIMVATNAFGMGIDKPNVRVVVHMELPNTPEGYFQEAGRAGRDGKTAFSALLYKPSDKLALERFHELEFPEKKEIKKVYNLLGNYFRLAIGGGEFVNYEFDLAHFCSQFNLNPLLTYNCLSMLSLAGYISVSEAVYRPPRLKITMNNNDLYNFKVRNRNYEGIIEIILRNNDSVFENYSKISPYLIGNKLNKTEQEVEKILTHLTSLEVLDYKPASDVPLLTFLQNRVHEDRIILPKQIYQDRKKIKNEQLQFMIHFCESDKICRSKQLLSYFNETEFTNCGKCDVCLKAKKEQLSTLKYQEIENKILSSLANSPKDIKSLVNGIMEYEEEEVIKVVQWKLDSNELFYNKQHELTPTKK